MTAEPTVDDDSSRDAERVERAIALADALLRASQSSITSSERERQERLGRLVADPAGRDLVFRLTDEVLRLERPRAAADRFAGLVSAKNGPGIPPSISGRDRFLMAAAARAAQRPAAGRDAARQATDRRRDPRAHHPRRRPRADPAPAQAGVGAHEAQPQRARRGDPVATPRPSSGSSACIATLQRPDVDYVSVKISAVCALLDVYAFEHSVQRICQALRRIYDAAIAADPPTFVNLDMEEYADLELTVESFLKVLDEPPYFTMPAGIVLQAYLPDSHVAMERIGAWAAARVASGGAPIKVRIVKGANLAMEQVDAEQHGWAQAPYATKADVDASYKRLLDSCLRPEWAGAVRVGVASHNLFDVAWALTLRDELPESRRGDIEIEMLEGMVPAQARAVAGRGRRACSCTARSCARTSSTPASPTSSRRFDENTAPENFLRAMFTMTPGSAEFAEQAERFRASVAERSTVTATLAPSRAGRARRPTASFENQPDTDFTDAAARAAVAGGGQPA